MCIPYIAGLSEDIKRITRSYNVRTVFTAQRTLQQSLTKVQDHLPDALKAYVRGVQDNMQLWRSVHWRETESPRHENPRTSRCLPPLQTREICCRRTRSERWPPSRLGEGGDRGHHLKEDGAIGEGGNPHPANTKGATTLPRQGLANP